MTNQSEHEVDRLLREAQLFHQEHHSLLQREAEVLFLKQTELTYREIGHTLGISSSSAQEYWRRAKPKYRQSHELVEAIERSELVSAPLE